MPYMPQGLAKSEKKTECRKILFVYFFKKNLWRKKDFTVSIVGSLLEPPGGIPHQHTYSQIRAARPKIKIKKHPPRGIREEGRERKG